MGRAVLASLPRGCFRAPFRTAARKRRIFPGLIATRRQEPPGGGGHGHNDALSFEAWLEGAPLVIDRGSFVYTASFDKRNEFRSTFSHNTPCVDREEMNRFDPDNLWTMQNDARAECRKWHSDAREDLFVGVHHGYQRLGVEVKRQIRLEKESGGLE